MMGKLCLAIGMVSSAKKDQVKAPREEWLSSRQFDFLPKSVCLVVRGLGRQNKQAERASS
ncbi:uncharacterized protein LY79DRAFT_548918 [Colletotrichum navitas]|uniref:Uncharacterized protein n=1 Tax=Colletotrichum navitas TaxID=681940 RepID=A0AAD8Q3T0_9PEZI|nr:uncharacterized protein LY79DRAFT_548918 [Colletotrichum navitas]KAK1594522.1 hypothetical protein LY79DRAFT_548918 [Colletotrichum navitas]